ncbi:MAG: biotin-dependent carboxyltransferase family protein [Oscillospiraceae bacterium]|jgi:biotin-dependent carboxylase-like uncharacterized protein|nr:biotin-dependent carboxyltransferase family protein [Oscillospiraceae bacterium]
MSSGVDRTLRIQSPGMLTTAQDAGRVGWMASGFSRSGAMDLPSLRRANLLVGNDKDMAALEMTMTGVACIFGCDCVFSLTGADMCAALNGQPIPRYTALQARAGDTLACGGARVGMRGYLAVAGGFDLPAVLGSCSTGLKFGLGGFAGRKLRAGDALPLRCPEIPVSRLSERVLPVPNALDAHWRAQRPGMQLRVVLGPQAAHFTAAGVEAFLSSWYVVTPASDRMGMKLEGKKIEAVCGYDVISDGVAPGSVQVPASGQPIVMMADCQTTGGYAKIATVAGVALPLLAQAKPGDKICFAAIDVREAQRLARREAAQLRRMEIW